MSHRDREKATRKRLQEKSKARRKREKDVRGFRKERSKSRKKETTRTTRTLPPKTQAPVKKASVRPTITATRKEEPKRQSLLEAAKREIEKVKIIPGVEGSVPLEVKAALAAAIPTGGATATITRTSQLGFKAVKTSTRTFTGQGTKKVLEKLFTASPKTAKTTARFGTNTKSAGLSTSLLVGLGLSISAAGILVGAVSSYPFAGFIKEEALQTLGFAFNTAERNRDIVGMESAVATTEEIVNAAPTIIDKIPYANVQKQLRSFFEAVRVKLEVDRRRLEAIRGEEETGVTAFQEERAEGDFQARQRELEKQGLNSEYFALIREGKFEEAEKFRISQIETLKGGN